MSPLLNQAIVAAVAEGVQVALLSKLYSAQTIQVIHSTFLSLHLVSSGLVCCIEWFWKVLFKRCGEQSRSNE